jgi:hypothetical protein
MKIGYNNLLCYGYSVIMTSPILPNTLRNNGKYKSIYIVDR